MYGLGADAANADAVRRLYAVKGRPADHPVIVHVGARRAARRARARRARRRRALLADAFWPGPLTIVVRRNPDASCREVDGRARHGRPARARSSGRARAARRVRRGSRGAVGQPLRPREPDHRRARARRSRRRRATSCSTVARAGSASSRRSSTSPAPSRAILRVGGVSRARGRARSSARECALRTTRRGRGAGHARVALRAAMRASRSSTARAVGARARELRRRAVGASGCSRCGSRPPTLPERLVVLDAPRRRRGVRARALRAAPRGRRARARRDPGREPARGRRPGRGRRATGCGARRTEQAPERADSGG